MTFAVTFLSSVLEHFLTLRHKKLSQACFCNFPCPILAVSCIFQIALVPVSEQWYSEASDLGPPSRPEEAHPCKYFYPHEHTWWLSGKKSACSAGDVSTIPGSGRSLGGGHDNPLQYFCWKTSMARGAW